FGGVSYAADERLAEHLSQHYGVDADSLLQAFNSGVPQNTAAAWKFLPGTLSEVFHIADQLAANNREPILFTGAAASEEQFKKLTGSMAPQILHVATHGFAIPIESKKTAYQIFENSFVENNNPLFRTGLLLAGASRIWDKAPAIPGIEDGILTAYEVSNLDLRNTRLVVLSACETGLGDVKGSEGVYGLQRAFKMAGVPYVIASLWPVPDKETAVFMQLFYKNLLKTKDVRTAFAKTQKSMRKKYEPYYWAAFVLVE
ncbi:MAG TPA: CHAT domain-containing protein, partial [Bacteroidales bacterium]|nr:CHAT domain-containing protein [Bacteroidales bacterium]